jgi:subtilisin family serine protease
MSNKETKTKWITLECPIFYAQVFEDNRDKAEMHSDVQGVTKVTMGLTEDQVNTLKEMGIPAVMLGYQTFKKNPALVGDDMYTFVAKRPWVSKYIKDDNGEPLVMGAPEVFDYNAAVDKWREAGSVGKLNDYITPWTMEDGLIGNGTIAKVKLSIYNGKNKAGKPTNVTTLEAVAIVDHVPYEGSGDDNDPWF